MKGKSVGHFRIESSLGSGGMGEVFAALDTKLNRRVALKLLKGDGTGGQLSLLDEARAACAIQHQNVATVYDAGEVAGVSFIAMELVDGEPLSARIEGSPLPVREAVSIAAQIADALDAAHQNNLVHRDIKPGNVLVTRRGVVKVVDFGLALRRPRKAASDQTAPLSDLGITSGTIQYMSPEQALGRAVDARADIFGLGAVLYEMAAGVGPFDAGTAQECLARVLDASPEPLARRNPKVPEDLSKIVTRCLARDPAGRFQSARELAAALRDLLADAPRSSPAPPRTPGSKIRVIVVDDEELARLLMRDFLKRHAEVEIIAECSNGFEAVKAVSELKPDLIFLDVQMPKLDGFEVLELVGQGIPVIFATAYDQYAMKAFDAHAVDYLLKPFSAERLSTALARARERMGQRTPPVEEVVRDARPPDAFSNRVVVRDGSKVTIIPAEKLDYVLAQDDYVELHSDKKSYLKQQTISSLEATLDPRRFLRVHRSAIINLERIARIEPYGRDSRVVVLNDGTQLPVSRGGYAKLREVLGERI